MRRRLMFAAVATLLVAVPAVVLARGNGPIESNIAVSGGQTTWSTAAATTSSKTFKAVHGLARFEPGNLDYDPGAALHVTVDLRTGKAQLQLRDAGIPSAAIDPGAVLLAAKGVSTATFLVVGSNTIADPVIQWKRVGRARVEAQSVTVDLIGPLD